MAYPMHAPARIPGTTLELINYRTKNTLTFWSSFRLSLKSEERSRS